MVSSGAVLRNVFAPVHWFTRIVVLRFPCKYAITFGSMAIFTADALLDEMAVRHNAGGLFLGTSNKALELVLISELWG
jgi:hypothetical protein